MQISVKLQTIIEIIHRENAQQIESKTIGDNISTRHRRTLLGCIKLLIQRILATHVLVQRYTNRVFTHNNTLVERSYLRIEGRQLQLWHPGVQTLKRLFQLLVDIIHIGILSLSIGYKRLQGRVLIEHQKPIADIGIGNRS